MCYSGNGNQKANARTEAPMTDEQLVSRVRNETDLHVPASVAAMAELTRNSMSTDQLMLAIKLGTERSRSIFDDQSCRRMRDSLLTTGFLQRTEDKQAHYITERVSFSISKKELRDLVAEMTSTRVWEELLHRNREMLVCTTDPAGTAEAILLPKWSANSQG